MGSVLSISNKSLAGVYIHIPFCRKACHYCSFHFSTNRKNQDELVASLLREIVLRANYLADEPIKTIYFGGGTPSILSSSELEKILTAIKQNYQLDSQIEISLEANPEDLTLDKCLELNEIGINRLSIGIQSIQDHELTFMNRAHDSTQSLAAIKNAQKAGFINISVDLMFGLINSNLIMWQQNLQAITALGIPHISCYNLTIEEQTALSTWVKKDKIKVPDEHYQKEQFIAAHDFLSSEGYEHYEISNYATSGFNSQHNSNYWEGVKYLGIGPAAHSFDGQSRSWNIANNALYISTMQQGLLNQEIEILSDIERYNESIMLALRRSKGLNAKVIDSFTPLLKKHFLKEVGDKIASGIIIKENDHYKLHLDYWYISDSIIADLFYAN
jgi:oxygen-independent coproporphyrinogen-3 oxidase